MAAAKDLTGITLDARYRLTRLMGAGGMGQVYEGVHDTLDRKVAVKVLLPRFAYDERFRERFLREAKAASKVRHPNVVEILDFGTTPNDSVYFAMEFLEGRDLRILLHQDGPLKWSRARHLLLQMTAAFTAAHEAKIIHRDIKPANFFVLDRHGLRDFIKVLDFGIAKVASDPSREDNSLAQSLTGTGEIFGTAKYMAPEQAFGASDDPRVDVYSLGVVAYEMLTKQVPFKGVSAFEIITRHVNDTPRPLRELVPDIPPAVEAVVLRAMGKKPEDRYASMDALGEAFAAIPVDAPGAAPPLRRTRLADAELDSQRNAPPHMVPPTPASPGAPASVDTVTSPSGFSTTAPSGRRVDVPTYVAGAPTASVPLQAHPHTEIAVYRDDSGPSNSTARIALDAAAATGSMVGQVPGLGSPAADTSPTNMTATGFRPRSQTWLAVLAGIAVVVLAAFITVSLLSGSEDEPKTASVATAAAAPKVIEPRIVADESTPDPAAATPTPAPEPTTPEPEPANGDATPAPVQPTAGASAATPTNPEPAADTPPASAEPPAEPTPTPTSKPKRGPKPKPIETDARAKARLAKMLKRRCKSTANGERVSISFLIRSTGMLGRQTIEGASPALSACLAKVCSGFEYPKKGVRRDQLTISF